MVILTGARAFPVGDIHIYLRTAFRIYGVGEKID
jgi:hypothetical protein